MSNNTASNLDLSPFHATTATLNEAVIGREAEVMMLQVAVLGGFNGVLIGEPGTAKSYVAKLVCEAYAPGEKHTTFLHHPQMTADEVIGGADLGALVRDKQIIHRWENTVGDDRLRLVIDEEVFNATGALLTAKMTAYNEGYVRGVDGSIRDLTVGSFLAVTNEFPSGIGGRRRRGDIDMSALWDRFHLRMGVSQLASQTSLAGALQARAKGRPTMEAVPADFVETVGKACREASDRAANRQTVVERVTAWVHKCREEGLRITDRRAGILLDVASTHGVLHGREIPNSRDLQWAAMKIGFEGLDSINILTDPEVSNLLIPELPTEVADFMTEARAVHSEVQALFTMADANQSPTPGAEQQYVATKNRVGELNQSLATLKAAGHGGYIEEAGFPEIRGELTSLLPSIKSWASQYNW